MNAHNEQPDPASPVVKQNLTTQPAAAQEAVAEVIDIIGRSGVEIHWLGGPAKIGDLLYAAPVAAAPVGEYLANVDASGGVRWINGAPPHGTKLYSGTPAAPGIDLEPFRRLVEWNYDSEFAAYEHGHRTEEQMEEAEAERTRLLALIDASPKGALNEQFGSAEGFKAHLAEFIKLGRRLVSALYNSPRDEISMTDTGDWIQYASQLLQLDKAKGGSDLIECVDRIEEAIEHRVPHDIYGAVRVELAEIRHLAQVSSPKGGSEARDSVLAALVEAATAVERADADSELTDDLVDRLRAARDAAQAGDAEVQP